METYSTELVDELRALGLKIDLRCLPGNLDGTVPNLARLFWFGLSVLWDVTLRRGRWDVIHGADLAIWPLVWWASFCAHSKPGVLLSAHGTDISFAFRRHFPGGLYRLYLALGRRALPENCIVLSNSQATDQRVAKRGFAHRRVVPLGCRVVLSDPLPLDRDRILFAGRLVRRKGLRWFVENVLPRTPEPLRLTVVGPKWDPEESDALTNQRVEYLGSLPQTDLWRLMRASLAVVIPNRDGGDEHFEGFGLVAPEAAAAGAIVLASDLDGFRDSVVQGATGQLLPADDPVAWADEIDHLASLSESDLEERRLQAEQVSTVRYDWKRVALETQKIYGEFVS